MRLKRVRGKILTSFYTPLVVRGIARACIAFTVMSIFCASSYAEGLPPGSRYKLIRPVYLMAVYEDIENKLLTRETARGYLNAIELYEKRWMAFQSEVPAGTIMTIIGVVPKIWYFPFSFDRYLVQLDPDLSRGLDVELELDRGLEGSLDGLNPEIFSREKPTHGSELIPQVDGPGL